MNADHLPRLCVTSREVYKRYRLVKTIFLKKEIKILRVSQAD